MFIVNVMTEIGFIIGLLRIVRLVVRYPPSMTTGGRSLRRDGGRARAREKKRERYKV